MSKPRMLQCLFTLWISTNPTLTVYSASLLEVMRWKMLSMTFGMTPCVLPPGVKALPMVYVLPDPVWPYANTAGRQAELIDGKCVLKSGSLCHTLIMAGYTPCMQKHCFCTSHIACCGVLHHHDGKMHADMRKPSAHTCSIIAFE